MKHIKKIVSLLLCAAMLAGTMAGCLDTSTAKNNASLAAQSVESGETPASSDPQTPVNKDAIVIKISNGAAEMHPACVAERDVFAKLVEEGTEGRYRVEVYHSAQLGDDIKSTEAVRAGTLEAVCTTTAPLVGFCKELAIFDIPFLFTSPEVADKVIDGPIGQKIAEQLPQNGLVLIGWWEYGFRNLTNSKLAVDSPDDLKGLKIRTMDNKIHLKAWELLGANPTPMSWSEVFTALQQKAIDGQENPLAAIFTSQIFEVNKHISLTQHVYSPLVLLMSKKVWDQISPEDQKVFMNAAREAGLYERELNRKEETKYIEQMREAGATVTELSAEDKKAFQDLTLPVWDMVGETVGNEMITELKAEVEAASK